MSTIAAAASPTTARPHFPNAQYYISQADFDYWTDPAKVPASFSAFLDTARKNLLPIRDRLVFVKDGQEFLPGIQAIAARPATASATRCS